MFATGWFSEVDPDAEDTRDGVKLIIRVGGELAAGTCTGRGSGGDGR